MLTALLTISAISAGTLLTEAACAAVAAMASTIAGTAVGAVISSIKAKTAKD